MRESYRFLWLEGVFDEETVDLFKTISPASNFWQRGFIQALQRKGHDVDVIGYAVERVWPFGRLAIRGHHAKLLQGLTGRVIGYANLPLLRSVFQYLALRRATIAFMKDAANPPDFLVVFSCLNRASEVTPAIRVARDVRRRFGLPWVCIVADGEAPPGADAYVYLTWSYYQSEGTARPAIHIDGGIADVPPVPEPGHASNAATGNKVLMYFGALTAHGGVTELARAFQRTPGAEMRLWVCGRGENPELAHLAAMDRRIELKGFVEEAELNSLARAAWAFANPRPHGFAPNKLNYPSKVLHYLAYGKPIISTFTEGISPEYADVLLPVPGESDASLSTAIVKVMNLPAQEYEAYQRRIAEFSTRHTWAYQAERFVSWLHNLKLGASAPSEAP
jgi:glycosyltransferase involved in cell wall biosynthesis